MTYYFMNRFEGRQNGKQRSAAKVEQVKIGLASAANIDVASLRKVFFSQHFRSRFQSALDFTKKDERIAGFVAFKEFGGTAVRMSGVYYGSNHGWDHRFVIEERMHSRIGKKDAYPLIGVLTVPRDSLCPNIGDIMNLSSMPRLWMRVRKGVDVSPILMLSRPSDGTVESLLIQDRDNIAQCSPSLDIMSGFHDAFDRKFHELYHVFKRMAMQHILTSGKVAESLIAAGMVARIAKSYNAISKVLRHFEFKETATLLTTHE
jgi:hypothetical protein